MVIDRGVRVRYGAQALQALALLQEEGIPLRKSHLKEVRTFYGGSSMVLSALSRVRFGDHIYAMEGVWWSAGDRYSTDVSTSMDSKFKEQMEKNLNKVAGKLREYGEPGLADQCFVRFEESDNEHIALFQGEFAYLAAWKLPDVAVNGTLIQRPLRITDMTVSRGIPDLEADLLLGGKSAKDDVADAFRAIAVQDMLEKVKVRPEDMSVRTAVRGWSQFYGHGYPDAGAVAFVYKQYSTWFMIDSRAGDVPRDQVLQNRLEDVRRELIGSEMEIFDQYAYRYGAAALLTEMRKIAVRAGDLSIKYAGYLYGGVAAEPAVEAVGPRGDADALAGGADALAVGAGDDICDTAECGGKTEVTGGGLNDIPGVGFCDRWGMVLAAHTKAVDASMATDSSLSAAQIRTLHGELSGILRAFQFHVGGSLHQTKGELQIRYQAVQQNKEIFAETQQRLSDIASFLALFAGQLDYMTPEEEYIAARNVRYSVIHREFETDGQKVAGTMVRIKENGKRSHYIWMPAFMTRVMVPFDD